MTRRPEPLDDISAVLARTDRNQRFAVLASLLGYAVWIVATLRYIRLAEHSGLPDEVTSLLREGALLLLFGGFATQFMVCNYINQMARRILRAIDVARTFPPRTPPESRPDAAETVQ